MGGLRLRRYHHCHPQQVLWWVVLWSVFHVVWRVFSPGPMRTRAYVVPEAGGLVSEAPSPGEKHRHHARGYAIPTFRKVVSKC